MTTTPETEETLKEQRKYRELMTEIASRLHEVKASYRAKCIVAALNIVRDNRGCLTPTEDFLEGLLREYHMGSITPDYVRDETEKYADEFTELVEFAKFLQAKYLKEFEGHAA